MLNVNKLLSKLYDYSPTLYHKTVPLFYGIWNYGDNRTTFIAKVELDKDSPPGAFKPIVERPYKRDGFCFYGVRNNKLEYITSAVRDDPVLVCHHNKSYNAWSKVPVIAQKVVVRRIGLYGVFKRHIRVKRVKKREKMPFESSNGR